MFAKRSKNQLVVRLEPGEELFPSLLEAVKSNSVSQGIVISGIGHLAQVRLGYFIGEGKYAEKDFPEGGELLNLSGNLSEKEGQPFFHLHATFGNEDYTVFGGHLVSAMVDVTCEVLILAVDADVRMFRQLDDDTKLYGLYLE